MTNEEQREIMMRGATMAACAVAVSVTFPMLADKQSEQRADADYREQARQLALLQDGGDTVRTADHSVSLLDHPWLRTVEYSLERDTDASMSRYAMRDRDGAAIQSYISFRPDHVKQAETIEAERQCMAEAVYYESANEPLEGQMAVAEVVMNRVRDHRYPNTVCGVVFQGSTRTTGCQFSFTCDGAMDRKPKGAKWERSQSVADHILMDLNETRTGGATHYHATYVDPVWNAGLIKTDKIGLHIFYRFPRGAEWQQVRQFKRKPKRNKGIVAASVDTNKAATSLIRTVSASTTAAAPELTRASYSGTAYSSETSLP